MQVKFGPVRGIEKIESFLQSLPRGVVKVGLEAIGEWFVGSDNRGLRHYPGYKYVSRARAGYRPMSAKMRRWFWANGGPDMIGNNRTGATKAGWRAVPGNNGYRMSLQNSAPGAYYTMSDKGQAAQPAAVGWRKVSEVVSTNIAGAMRHAVAAINALLKSGKSNG
jgi:hypothetical protein